MNYVDFIESRGLIYQTTDINSLKTLFSTKGQRAYIGFDCTADSLHVGSLIPLLLLKYLTEHGHTPVILLGGGTTKVGDPSGKTTSRKILQTDSIERNKKGIMNCISKIVDTSSAIVLDNSEWLDSLKYIQFLRDYGSHFTVNKMIAMDTVKTRLEANMPMSFLEFNYIIMQSYDYLYLNSKYNVSVQMGGSDQWGNITNGVDLIRRINGDSAHVITAPLLTNSNGAKMGKTESGAIWLDSEKTSLWDYWQFWRNIEDQSTIPFLQKLTDIPINDINELSKLEGSDINKAKIILANYMTTLVHGKEAATSVLNSVSSKDDTNGMNQVNISPNLISDDSINIVQLVKCCNINYSMSEIRRLIKNNGIKCNGETVQSFEQNIQIINDKCIISIGKSKKYSINIEK